MLLNKWFDLHTHFRQGPNVADYVRDHLKMGCAGALAMPNTLPPVSRVLGDNQPDSWSIEAYHGELIAAGGDQFEQLIVPLYLTAQTTADLIDEGAKSGVLKACKYYPPHGTTNSAHGVPMEHWIGSDVIRSLEENEIILCIHGEQHGLVGPEYFDSKATAESKFYDEWMPRLLETHPNLKVVCEHITTETAASFVKQCPSEQVGATITPQHLLYTVGHLIQGLKYHLYCLPIVKFEQDRASLRQAVSTAGQSQFFAGTDSAPHTGKMTECGCAAGCYTGGCAPQLYAMAFEEAGLDLVNDVDAIELFSQFLCQNGPSFYGFEPSSESFELKKTEGAASPSEVLTATDGEVVPLPVGMGLDLTWEIG